MREIRPIRLAGPKKSRLLRDVGLIPNNGEEAMGMAGLAVDEEQLMNRLRWRIIPYVMFLYVVTIIDRVNVSFAALGMNKDLGISMTSFGTIAGIFFISYFIFEIPSNVILHRVGARMWIARIMITWGIVTFFTGFARGVTDVAICRFLLGAAEAGFYPGIVLYFTYWFPARHHARAVSLFLIGLGVANILGGPFATWILDNIKWFGLAGWRWIFIAEGVLTVVLGVVTLFILVNRPQVATFLSEDEKKWLVARLAAEHETRTRVLPMSKWGTLKNGRVWYFTLCYFGYAVGMSLLFFWVPQILKRLSSVLTNTQVGWISSIPYVCAVIAMVAIARHSDKTMERRWHSGLSMAVMVLALIGLTQTHNLVLSVILFCLAASGIYSFVAVFWALPTALLGEATAAVGIALINSIGNLGNFVGPYFFGFLADFTHSTVAGTYLTAAFVLMTTILTICVPKRHERAATGEITATDSPGGQAARQG
jgi:ACS family tartrate transporter-like MFS transporter